MYMCVCAVPTAVCAVMCVQPMILAPCSGLSPSALFLSAINPGISETTGHIIVDIINLSSLSSSSLSISDHYHQRHHESNISTMNIIYQYHYYHNHHNQPTISAINLVSQEHYHRHQPMPTNQHCAHYHRYHHQLTITAITIISQDHYHRHLPMPINQYRDQY